jgi:hypothetical protein
MAGLEVLLLPLLLLLLLLLRTTPPLLVGVVTMVALRSATQILASMSSKSSSV